MERQTRQLLEVLADELTDSLLGELSGGEVLETELQRRCSSSRQTISRRLAELELREADVLLLSLLEEKAQRHRSALHAVSDRGNVKQLHSG